MHRVWAWTRILCYHLRHIEGWRLAWAAALALGLWGWALMQSLEGQTRATALTLLFQPGFGEADIHRFLKTLPERQTSRLREPSLLREDAQHLLEKLGLSFEGEAWPVESEATGWAAELHWRGLSSEAAQQLREQLEASPFVEEALWVAPLSYASLDTLQQASYALFALATGTALLALSLHCLQAEARHLKVLLALGASPGQLKGLWLAQGLLWALLVALTAYVLWKGASQAWGLPVAEARWSGFMALGAVGAATVAWLAWALRGKACCAWP